MVQDLKLLLLRDQPLLVVLVVLVPLVRLRLRRGLRGGRPLEPVIALARAAAPPSSALARGSGALFAPAQHAASEQGSAEGHEDASTPAASAPCETSICVMCSLIRSPIASSIS